MSAKEMFEDLKINEWLELIKEDKNLKGAYICISQYIYLIQQENQELKKQLEEYKHKGLYNTCLPYSTGYKKAIKEKESQQKEFIEYLENEKDRLARECSQIYEDSLGKTKLVNEDIFNEVDAILSKYTGIIGDDK